MSWSIFPTDPVTANEIDSLNPVGQYITEAEDQADIAKQVAKDIIDSGKVGTGPYKVVLGGHANPNHEPQDGYASDVISVSVARA